MKIKKSPGMSSNPKDKNRSKGLIKRITLLSAIGLSFAVGFNFIYEKAKYAHFLLNKEKYIQEYILTSFHSHSQIGGGDGFRSVEWIIENAYLEGYGIYSITDHEQPPELNAHDTMSKLEELAETNFGDFDVTKVNETTYKVTHPDKDHVLYVLNGAEITVKHEGRDTHVLGIGISSVPDSSMTLDEVLSNLSNQGALIGAPHPTTKMAFGLGENAVTQYQAYFDFLEGNGSLPFPVNIIKNGTAENLAKKLNIPYLTQSDAHLTTLYFNKALVMIEKSDTFDENNIVGFLKEQISEGKYKNVLITVDNLKLYEWILFGKRQ